MGGHIVGGAHSAAEGAPNAFAIWKQERAGVPSLCRHPPCIERFAGHLQLVLCRTSHFYEEANGLQGWAWWGQCCPGTALLGSGPVAAGGVPPGSPKTALITSGSSLCCARQWRQYWPGSCDCRMTAAAGCACAVLRSPRLRLLLSLTLPLSFPSAAAGTRAVTSADAKVCGGSSAWGRGQCSQRCLRCIDILRQPWPFAGLRSNTSHFR